MELVEAFHLFGTEPRHASFAAQQFGELGRELSRRPDLPTLCRVIVDAPLGFCLLLLLVAFLEQFQILVIQGGLMRLFLRLRMSTSLALIAFGHLQESRPGLLEGFFQ